MTKTELKKMKKADIIDGLRGAMSAEAIAKLEAMTKADLIEAVLYMFKKAEERNAENAENATESTENENDAENTESTENATENTPEAPESTGNTTENATKKTTAEDRKTEAERVVERFCYANKDTSYVAGVNARANSYIVNYKKRRVGRVIANRSGYTIVTNKDRFKVATDVELITKLRELYLALVK